MLRLLRAIAVGLAAHDHFTNATSSGEQQFAHGMAALDLSAVENRSAMTTGSADPRPSETLLRSAWSPARRHPYLIHSARPWASRSSCSGSSGSAGSSWRRASWCSSDYRSTIAWSATISIASGSPSAVLQEGRRQTGDPFASTDRPEPLGSSARQRDRRADRVTQRGLHLFSAGRQLGLLGDHRAVDVQRRPPVGRQPLHDGTQQLDAVGAFPLRIVVGEEGPRDHPTRLARATLLPPRAPPRRRRSDLRAPARRRTSRHPTPGFARGHR